MKLNRRPLLAIIPAVALAGSMLTAPVAGAQSSFLPEDVIGDVMGSVGSSEEDDSEAPVTPAPCDKIEVVNSQSAEGWSTPGDETAAEFRALANGAEKNAPAGPGGLFFPDFDPNATPKKPGTSLYKKVNKPLKDLLDADGKVSTDIGFSYYSDGTAPALQLRITGASGVADNGFATIVLSPENSDKAWKKLTPDTVKTSDKFWVTKDIKDAEGEVVLKRQTQTATLAEIIALNPGATLQHVGVQKTQENKTANTYVDNFVFGCETTNFEAAPDGFFGSLENPDFGSLALGGGLALAAALAVGGGAWAIQNGMIQLPPELAALLPA